MNSKSSSFVEHVAIRVYDMKWYVKFLTEVLGMSVVKTTTGPGDIENVWLNGGIQLISQPDPLDKNIVEHLCIVTENLEAVMQKMDALDQVTRIPNKPIGTWVRLPDGLVLELFEQKDHSVQKVLSIAKR